MVSGNEATDCYGTVRTPRTYTSQPPTRSKTIGANPFGRYTSALAVPSSAMSNVTSQPYVGEKKSSFPVRRKIPRPVDNPGASNADDACDIGAVENQDGEVVVASGEAPDERAPMALSVGPNPASGAATLTLSVPAATEATVELFDARGRRVRTLHAGPVSAEGLALRLDTSALPAGVYLVRASTPEAASG